jgi:carbamoyl-phosphate synthase large subunit
MKSTGEVMGHASRFGHAFAKAQIAAGTPLPLSGAALLTVNDFDKAAVLKIGRDLHRMGFTLFATPGTAAWLTRAGLPVTVAKKVGEGHPDIRDLVEQGVLQLIVNTPLGARAYDDSRTMRGAAIMRGVTLVTTLSAAAAAVNGIAALKAKELSVRSLQDHYKKMRG